MVLIVGSPSDRSLDGAARYAIDRAGAIGGSFRIWHSRDAGDPLDSIRDIDITGGQLDRDSAQLYEREPDDDELGFNDLLADCQNCRGRITELTIFHHGDAVDELVLGDRLLKILQGIQVPVCRVVWWACDAAVTLDVSLGGWTDSFMKSLGGLARCSPCGCGAPVELVFPTEGRCFLTPDGAGSFIPQSGSGNVNRVRWGYPQPGGGIGIDPDPGDPQPTRNPPAREPDYDMPIVPGPGRVLGLPVTPRPS